jgi:hypothetical protein
VEALATRLTRLEAKGIFGGQWIRALQLPLDCELSEPSAAGGLMSILSRAHCLRLLQSLPFLSPSAALAMSYACPTTMQNLHVGVNDPALLVHIQAFRCLRHLSIRTKSHLTFEDIPPLTLTGIMRFDWMAIRNTTHTPQHDDHGSALRYIERCDLRPLSTLQLFTPNLQRSDVPDMLNVLRKHKPAHLCLAMDNPYCAMAVLPHACARRLDFSRLAPQLLSKISCEVETLDLVFGTLISSALLPDFPWQALRALEHGETNIREVNVSLHSRLGRFSWNKLNFAKGYDSFVANMLRLSILLQRRGIRLLDEDGKSMHLVD